MSNWQPIETAPQDGAAVLLYVPASEYMLGREMRADEFKVGEGLLFDGKWHWANDSCSCCWGPIYPTQPTHWMPLPEAPSE